MKKEGFVLRAKESAHTALLMTGQKRLSPTTAEISMDYI
jgi:hypothetical protein